MRNTASPPLPRQFAAQTYLNVKAQWRDLVAACGGPLRAASLTRGSQSRISEAMAPHESERFPALDQVIDLEAECGSPVITRHMADLAGYDLVPRAASAAPRAMHEHLSHIASECGDVQSKLAAALADGRVDATERGPIRAEIRQAIAALTDTLASLDAMTPVARPVRAAP